jgi:propanol-preferring alcohol dehydrogenase
VALQSGDDVADHLRRELGAPALVVDCVGSDATLALAGEVVAPGGHVSIIGNGRGHASDASGSVPMETTVVISTGARAPSWLRSSRSRARGSSTWRWSRWALPDVVDAYERLERGDVRGRVVAVPEAA